MFDSCSVRDRSSKGVFDGFGASVFRLLCATLLSSPSLMHLSPLWQRVQSVLHADEQGSTGDSCWMSPLERIRSGLWLPFHLWDTLLDLFSLPRFWFGLNFCKLKIFEACSHLKAWSKFAKKLHRRSEVIEGWMAGQWKCLISFSQGTRLRRKSWHFFWEPCTDCLDRFLHSWISQDRPLGNIQGEQQVVKCEIFLQQAN